MFFEPLDSLLGGSLLATATLTLPGYTDPQTVLLPVVGATVNVYQRGTLVHADCFEDQHGAGQPAGQPLTTDVDGLVIDAGHNRVYVGQPQELDVVISGGNLPGGSTVTIPVGTEGEVDAGIAQAAGVSLLKAQNLADLPDAAAARASLGLGSAAQSATTAFDPAGAAAAVAAGLGSAASHAATDFDAAGLAGAEQARATAAEGTLTAGIADEVTRATAAEAALAADIGTGASNVKSGPGTGAWNAGTRAAGGGAVGTVQLPDPIGPDSEFWLTAAGDVEIGMPNPFPADRKIQLRVDMDVAGGRAVTFGPQGGGVELDSPWVLDTSSNAVNRLPLRSDGQRWMDDTPTAGPPSADQADQMRYAQAIPMYKRVHYLLTNAGQVLSGLPVVDGAQVSEGDSCLRAVTPPDANNGIWVMHAGVWVRRSDYPSGGSASARAVLVIGGSTVQANGGAPVIYVCGGTAPGASTAAAAAGAGMGIGTYKYQWTFVTAAGETLAGVESTVTTTAGNQQIAHSAIPTGPSNVIARRLYRTAVGGASGTEKLVATIADNTTTVYTDAVADGALGAAVPVANTAGGLDALIDRDVTTWQPGGAKTPVATNAAQGTVELATAPANPANPVAVGDNDPRVNRSSALLTASNAAWPVPAGATLLRVTAVGGGGGGGGAGSAAAAQLQGGGGGGGAGASVTRIVAVGANPTLNVTVGAGGTGGSGGAAGGASGNNGNGGNDTHVDGTGIAVRAMGGSGGGRTTLSSTTPGQSGVWGSLGSIGARATGPTTTSLPASGGPGGGSALAGGGPQGYTGGGGGGGGAASATNGGLGGTGGTDVWGGDKAADGSSATSAGGNGGNSPANTGAGGGGGGGGAAGTGAGGAGGNGGSGYVLIEVIG